MHRTLQIRPAGGYSLLNMMQNHLHAILMCVRIYTFVTHSKVAVVNLLVIQRDNSSAKLSYIQDLTCFHLLIIETTVLSWVKLLNLSTHAYLRLGFRCRCNLQYIVVLSEYLTKMMCSGKHSPGCQIVRFLREQYGVTE